jgi:hypothetical protein
MAGMVDAQLTRHRSDVAAGRHHAHLPQLGHRVRGPRLGQGVDGGPSGAERIEAARAVCQLREGLGRHRANACTGPWRDRTDGQEARLHPDTQLACRLVPSDDRVRHADTSRIARSSWHERVRG